MSYKNDNVARLRALDAKWRQEAQDKAFERDVEYARYRARVKAEAKMRDTLDALPPKHVPRGTMIALGTLLVIGRICKLLVVGTLVVCGSIIAGIIGASKHR